MSTVMAKRRKKLKNPEAAKPKYEFAPIWDIAPAPSESAYDWLVRVRLKNADFVVIEADEENLADDQKSVLISRQEEGRWELVTDKDIEALAEPLIEARAQERAAEAWSTPGDELPDEIDGIPVEWYIVAEFGYAGAINGELEHRPGEGVPKDAVRIKGKGGRVPVTEEEVDLSHVADDVERIMDLDDTRGTGVEEYIRRVVGGMGRKGYAYYSVSGEVETYVVYERPDLKTGIVIAEVVENGYYPVQIDGRFVAEFADLDDALAFAATQKDEVEYKDCSVYTLDADGKIDRVEKHWHNGPWKVIHTWEPES